MIPQLSKLALAFGAVATATACTSPRSDTTTGPLAFCTAPRSIAIQVAVRDSVSARALATGTIGTFMFGATSDTLEHVDTLTLIGGTMVGSYSITIERPGYATWTRSGVSSTQTGPCGNVEPVNLTALLQPLP